jgi:hypothetical protein
MTKQEAGYREQDVRKNNNNDYNHVCIKCKFNLPDEWNCHIVEGEINNENGISNYFSPKDDGILTKVQKDFNVKIVNIISILTDVYW